MIQTSKKQFDVYILHANEIHLSTICPRFICLTFSASKKKLMQQPSILKDVRNKKLKLTLHSGVQSGKQFDINTQKKAFL